ncbi:methyltransferase domain-containing protein [Shewanella maritima]|uniref:Methyltransferase domain-containing protein n=1 Tax=Shewanella maritima TaxID=2520507 RepID=A0A411PDI8_9GAMM|nr:methyltransferase domain-containing protein [Shewanella maritima]QBF81667.1 methyltransferase domain-containing protein [Shewanella maritima]
MSHNTQATPLQSQYLHVNQHSWDSKVAVHLDSKFYDVNSFKAGNTSLNQIELGALGSVAGKKLLHLQCHFGLDTLSWARLGAKVTGLDLSSKAIEAATTLASECGIDAEFICSDVYESEQTAKANFDLVFTSYGVLCWLPDIDRWARTVASHLKVGGELFIAEFHPIHDVFDGYRYFHDEQADIEVNQTYTENNRDTQTTEITWSHPVSDVINALIKAGIHIVEFNEFDYSPYNCFDNLTSKRNELLNKEVFQYLHQGNPVPLVYSIKGVKTA